MRITKRKNIFRKTIALFLMVSLIIGTCFVEKNLTTEIKADAFENSISGFPASYKPYLRSLHKKYPKWKFVPYNTGIDFNTALSKEYSGDRSLIENSYNKFLKSNESGAYNTSTGSYITKDGGTWVIASRNCIAYFLDPRNFLNDDYIYMFESLSFDSSVQTQSGIEAILQGSFMYKTKIGYINTAGKYIATNTLYSAQILNTAKSTKVSPYYIASKILQEIGSSKNSKYAGMGASGSITGKYSSTYKGIYNFYNIGAYSSSNPIANGLKWAKSDTTYQRPWTTPMKSILGGAQYIGAKYINSGQNTQYYQRFNVNKKSTYGLYEHQYMTNIYGAAAESMFTADAYQSMGVTSLAKTFIIPVYTNMPSDNNTVKLGSSSKAGKISSEVNLRKGPSTAYGIVTTLKKNTAVTILKGTLTTAGYGSRWLANPYWYQVTAKVGSKTYTGYVSSSYASVNSEKNIMSGQKYKLPVSLATNEKIYYRSDNPAKVYVSSDGYITAKKTGKTTIRAFTASGSMASMAVTVYTKGCVFNVASMEINRGGTGTIKSTVYPTNAVNKKVTYTSSNSKVATVSSSGKVKAISPGYATITGVAKAIGGAEGKCIVHVITPASKVALNKTNLKVAVKQKVKLAATVYPLNATYRWVKWKSANKKIATVSSKGKVKGKKPGVTTVTATTHNGKKVTCTVKVVPATPVAKIVSKNYNSIKLSWTKTSKTTKYYIYRKKGKGKYKYLRSVTSNVFTNVGLSKKKIYSYKIRAVSIIGKTKYKGSKSKAVSAKTS